MCPRFGAGTDVGALSASTRGVATSDILNRSRHSSLAGAVFLNNMHAADGGSCRSLRRLRWCGRTIGAPPVRMRLVPVRPKLPARELWETPRRYGRAEFGSTRSATPSSVLGTPATRSYDRSSSIVLRGRACRWRSRSGARPVRRSSCRPGASWSTSSTNSRGGTPVTNVCQQSLWPPGLIDGGLGGTCGRHQLVFSWASAPGRLSC